VGVSCSTTQIIAKPHTQLSLRWLPGNKTPFKNNRAKKAHEINEQVMLYRSLYTFLLRENVNKKYKIKNNLLIKMINIKLNKIM